MSRGWTLLEEGCATFTPLSRNASIDRRNLASCSKFDIMMPAINNMHGRKMYSEMKSCLSMK